MPQFRLSVPHTSPFDQQYLDAGTLVGDGTPYPWTDPRGNPVAPSLGMVGTDDESQGLVDRQYTDEVRNNPILPPSLAENTPEKATEDLTLNKPNPNVSPAATPPRQSPNESTVDPLRRGPQGAVPSAAPREPQGGQTLLTPNPLDNIGASPQDTGKK